VPLSEAWQRVIASRSGDKRQPSPPNGAAGNGHANAGAGGGATQPIDPASVASSVSSGGTRIRGSFGNADSSGKSQFEIALSNAENGNGGAPRAPSQGGYYRVHSGTPHAPATGATDGASAGGGAFSAGFALIAALFPGADATPTQGPTQAQPPSERGQRMDIATSAAAGGGRGTTLRGGYASLQPEEMDGSVLNWGAPFPQQQQPVAHAQPQYTSAQAHHWGPPTKASPQPQSQQQQHTHGTHVAPYHQQRQSHHYAQRSQPSQAAPLAQNFAQAFSALNTLTTQLSSSVFGPPPSSGANNNSGVQQSQTAGYNASMMSVPLEESFSV
jgi:hypothetical protein